MSKYKVGDIVFCANPGVGVPSFVGIVKKESSYNFFGAAGVYVQRCPSDDNHYATVLCSEAELRHATINEREKFIRDNIGWICREKYPEFIQGVIKSYNTNEESMNKSKYCPAGKVNCGRFNASESYVGDAYCVMPSGSMTIAVGQFEVCPVPSSQLPTKDKYQLAAEALADKKENLVPLEVEHGGTIYVTTDSVANLLRKSGL